MIQAVYYRKYNRLTVTGHAYAAEPGFDLVCASASILVNTLALNVASMADCGQVRAPTIKLEEGNAEISCNPRHNLKNSVTLVFDALCVGFEKMAHDYPQYIKYELRQ